MMEVPAKTPVDLLPRSLGLAPKLDLPRRKVRHLFLLMAFIPFYQRKLWKKFKLKVYALMTFQMLIINPSEVVYNFITIIGLKLTVPNGFFLLSVMAIKCLYNLFLFNRKSQLIQKLLGLPIPCL